MKQANNFSSWTDITWLYYSFAHLQRHSAARRQEHSFELQIPIYIIYNRVKQKLLPFGFVQRCRYAQLVRWLRKSNFTSCHMTRSHYFQDFANDWFHFQNQFNAVYLSSILSISCLCYELQIVLATAVNLVYLLLERKPCRSKEVSIKTISRHNLRKKESCNSTSISKGHSF